MQKPAKRKPVKPAPLSLEDIRARHCRVLIATDRRLMAALKLDPGQIPSIIDRAIVAVRRLPKLPA